MVISGDERHYRDLTEKTLTKNKKHITTILMVTVVLTVVVVVVMVVTVVVTIPLSVVLRETLVVTGMATR